MKYYLSDSDYERQPIHWVYLRLSDLFLTYAEALLQADNNFTDALYWVNEVRKRVGLGKLEDCLPNKNLTSDKDALLEEILRERACELGMEDSRYFDLIRYKRADRFEKKLHDLELTRMISIQTAPQIRLVQNNDTMMAEKIQTTLVNTIPLWKSQMVLALGIAHSTEAAQAQSQVSDLTNELLRKNAEKLHMASVETAKESERGIVDMETLQKTNADLIQTLDDVMKIQREGREKRQAAEAEMLKMENDLKVKLLEIQH